MATYERIPLSGSTNGRGIKVTGTGTGSTVTVHTAQSGTTHCDEIHLWAYNGDTQSRTLTVEWGGTSSPDDQIVLDVPPQAGAIYAIPGFALRNSLVVKAFASTANVVTVHGYVNRVSA